jgi:histidinol-phosphate phosphatase family protein
MNKLVFLDRDGVICEDYDLMHKKEQIELIPRSADAIKLLNENGYKVIIATNQPVVARGLCSEETVVEMNAYLEELIARDGAKIDRIYYCPHHPKKGDNPKYTRDCECRKPKPGMLLFGMKDFGLESLSECYIVGDSISDIRAGDLAGCKTILVRTGKGGIGEFNDATPMFTENDLYDAVINVILKEK